jgi:hypothetical protein
MPDPPPLEPSTFTLLREGAIGAVVLVAIAFVLSRFTRDIIGCSLLIIFLFIAAGAYFGFTFLAAGPRIWMLLALVQVIVFGTLGLLGLHGSPYWIAAGWALHPLWDAGLYYIGPEFSIAPITYYEIVCISFDWVVAAYIVIAYGFGLLKERRVARREKAV